MDSQDDAFRLTCDALKAKQKSLKKQGRGNRPNKTDAITDEEINILYEKKILGNETPESLLNTLWFNNSQHLTFDPVTPDYFNFLVNKMDADVTPDFDLGFIVNNESRADPDNEVMSRTNDEGLVSPPQVPPELIPLLDVSFDENLSEIMDEFDQNEHNRQTVASENTVVNLNPNAQFLNLNLNEVESFISNQENANTVKKTLRDVNLVRKLLKMKNENRYIHEIPV